MKYKELLEKLKDLTEQQLEQDVIFCPEDEKAYRISSAEVLSKPLYYDNEDIDAGCFELDLGEDSDNYELAYPIGTVLLSE